MHVFAITWWCLFIARNFSRSLTYPVRKKRLRARLPVIALAISERSPSQISSGKFIYLSASLSFLFSASLRLPCHLTLCTRAAINTATTSKKPLSGSSSSSHSSEKRQLIQSSLVHCLAYHQQFFSSSSSISLKQLHLIKKRNSCWFIFNKCPQHQQI